MRSLLDRSAPKDYIGNMAQVSVDLSNDLQHHVDTRAADAGLGDSAAYLRALAEQDRAAYRADVARVQALINEGIASGIDPRTPEQVLDEVIARIGRG